MPLTRKTPLTRKPMKRGKKRKPTEFARIYGSPARVRWVASLPCVVTRFLAARQTRHSDGTLVDLIPVTHEGPIQNAHVVGGGMGRKADARFVAPICKRHHAYLHHAGIETFQRLYGLDLLVEAARVQAIWETIQEFA